MEIKRAEMADLPEILALQRLAFQSELKLSGLPDIQPTRQTLAEAQSEFDRGHFLKAVDPSGAIVGSVRALPENGTLHVGKLIVHPDHQNRGLGAALMKELERICPHPRYALFTSAKSPKNVKFYLNLGYTLYDQRLGPDGILFAHFEKRPSPPSRPVADETPK